MDPDQCNSPPMETSPESTLSFPCPSSDVTISTAKEDRIALLALIEKWLETREARGRRMSHYVNLELLKLPVAEQFPRKWSDQSEATPYRSYSNTMALLASQHLDVASMRKMTEPYLFLYGSFWGQKGIVTEIIPQLQGSIGSISDRSINPVLDSVFKRDTEMSNKLITEIGTAIVIWILQDPRFVSDPLPPFTTSQDRFTWFRRVLEEQPLLYVISMFALFGSSLDIPFVFSEWHYGGQVGLMKSNLQELIRIRTPLVIDVIFRGMFNIDVAKGAGAGEFGCFRKWMTCQIRNIYTHEGLQHLQPSLADFPVAPSWPKIASRLLQSSVTGSRPGENRDRQNEFSEKESVDERPKTRERGRSSGSGARTGNKRKRRVVEGQRHLQPILPYPSSDSMSWQEEWEIQESFAFP